MNETDEALAAEAELFLARNKHGNDLGRVFDVPEEFAREAFAPYGGRPSWRDIPKHGSVLRPSRNFDDGKNRHYFSR